MEEKAVCMQKQVREFMQAFGQAVRQKPERISGDELQLRINLIAEEFDELMDGLESQNLAATADAMADLIYVVIGAANSMGIELAPVWQLVHEANMEKVKGGVWGKNGKVKRPLNWTHPDIEGEIRRQQNE